MSAASEEALDPERADALAEALSVGDVETLVRWGRGALRKERKNVARRRSGPPPGGRDANEYKIARTEELVELLVAALGYDPEVQPSVAAGGSIGAATPTQAAGG